MQISFDRIAASLLGLLYPSACPVCDKSSDRFTIAPFCSYCWEGIERLEGQYCRVCRKPLGSTLADICGECLSDPPPFEKVVAYGPYRDTLRSAIHLLKFSAIRRLSRPLASLLLSLDIPEVDVVVPVPIEARTLREREFNQVHLVGRLVARGLGVPIYSGVLFKKKETKPQVGLSRAARVRNLKGVFGMRRKLSGERVLLMDDVITTGTTVRECSKALRRSGAGKIFVASLARTITDGRGQGVHQ